MAVLWLWHYENENHCESTRSVEMKSIPLFTTELVIGQRQGELYTVRMRGLIGAGICSSANLQQSADS